MQGTRFPSNLCMSGSSKKKRYVLSIFRGIFNLEFKKIKIYFDRY